MSLIFAFMFLKFQISIRLSHCLKIAYQWARKPQLLNQSSSSCSLCLSPKRCQIFRLARLWASGWNDSCLGRGGNRRPSQGARGRCYHNWDFWSSFGHTMEEMLRTRNLLVKEIKEQKNADNPTPISISLLDQPIYMPSETSSSDLLKGHKGNDRSRRMPYGSGTPSFEEKESKRKKI